MARLNSTTINGGLQVTGDKIIGNSGLEVNGSATINENLTVIKAPTENNHVVRLGDFKLITVDGGLTLANNNGNIIEGEVTLSHVTSEIAELTVSGSTYVAALTFDDYGHVTGYATEEVTDTNQKIKVDVPNGTDIEFGVDDTVEFVAGDNISIEGDKASKTITISADDTHNSHAVISGIKADGLTTITSASASSGDITLGDSGVKAGEYGPTADQTPDYDDTFNVPDIKVNQKGIVTSVVNRTVKIPASDNTDTTYKLSAPNNQFNGYVTIDLTAEGSGSDKDSGVIITGDGATTVTTDTSGAIIISSPTYNFGTGGAQGQYKVGNTNYSVNGLSTTSEPKFKKVNAESFNATSDKRLKENIKEFTPQKSILNLPVVEFDFKESKVHQIGCLAQDLQEICPEIVVEGDDGYLSIQESKIIYLLLLEVKKLKDEVSKLRG